MSLSSSVITQPNVSVCLNWICSPCPVSVLFSFSVYPETGPETNVRRTKRKVKLMKERRRRKEERGLLENTQTNLELGYRVKVYIAKFPHRLHSLDKFLYLTQDIPYK